MARRKASEDVKKGSPEWMSTYGDLVTLLLTFFILLFSMATIDVAKFKVVMSSFSGAVSFLDSGPTIGEGDMLGNGISQFPDMEKSLQESEKEIKQKNMEELKQIASDFQTYFEKQNLSGKIDVQIDYPYVKLTFKDGVFFDKSRANLKTDAQVILDQLSNELLKYPKNEIKIEGHTDNDQINTPQFPSNWYLSSARAIAVASYFIDEKKFDPKRLSAEGFSEYRPIAPNDTKEGQAKNRRVEIKILSQNISNDSLQGSSVQ